MSQKEKGKARTGEAVTVDSIKQIEVGKFYMIHDGSKTGHPGYVVWKDDERNRYLVVRTDSDKPGDRSKESRGVRHIIPLSAPTSKGVLRSYIHRRPMLCKRRDFGSLLTAMRFHPKDMPLVEMVSKNPPERSSSLK